jgi:tripartite-type tricarboxylate transporter receptor subunit TctC
MWYGFFAPGGTPPKVVQALNATLVKALQDMAVRAQLQTLDIAVATDTPEGFAKLVKEDYDRWGAVIQSTGFTIGQ